MHFGLETISISVLYVAFLAAVVLSIFWKPIAGICFLIPIIPLQTMRYRLDQYPLGSNIILITMLAIAIGLMLRGMPLFPKVPWRGLLFLHMGYLSISLCLGSLYLGRAMPFTLTDPRVGEWKSYILMPMLLFLVAGSITSVKELKLVLLLICAGIFLLDRGAWGAVSGRDYSSYSDELRDSGPMGYAGSNGLGAFLAQAAAFVLVVATLESRWRWKVAYYALTLFSVIVLMYSLSRGGYVAFAVGFVFVCLAAQRKLLFLTIALGTLWTSLVPEAVKSRVTMTQTNEGELDHSSETRMTLWEDAFELIESNPITGTGYVTYAYMGRVGNYTDTHNIYIKILVETGIVGLLIFLTLLVRLIWSGFRLFLLVNDPLYCTLGLGLATWVLTSATANIFGDRWNYLQVNGYLWVLAGVLASALVLIEQESNVPAMEAIEENAEDVMEVCSA